MPRLRTARRTAISWVETRLRAEAQGDMMPVGAARLAAADGAGLELVRPCRELNVLLMFDVSNVGGTEMRGLSIARYICRSIILLFVTHRFLL